LDGLNETAIDSEQTINFNNGNGERKVVRTFTRERIMSLQSIAATVPAPRLHGVRRFTVPLVVALAAAALYDFATAADIRDAMAAYAAVH
jgi:hypothetical protein